MEEVAPMHDRNKRGWREDRLARWLLRRIKATEPITVAEFYLEVGRAVKWGVRRGLPLQAIAHSIGFPISDCSSALLYEQSPDRLKLQAMVENWSWTMIKDRVSAPLRSPSQTQG